jgi:predicted metalloprotease with PDZ domain
MKRVMSSLGALLLIFVTTSVQAQDRAALGVSMSDQPGDNTAGALVTNVSAGSPAAQAGLIPGDRIVAINRQPVSSYSDVMRIVGASAAGSQINVETMRGTSPYSASVTLGGARQVFPASLASVTTSAWSYPALPCNASTGCVQYYYRPHHHRYYSYGRSYCGGHRHHGCYSACR